MFPNNCQITHQYILHKFHVTIFNIKTGFEIVDWYLIYDEFAYFDKLNYQFKLTVMYNRCTRICNMTQ